MKKILSTMLCFLLGILGTKAQSVNINHGGVQTTYDAKDVTEIAVESSAATATEATLTFSRKTGASLSLPTTDVTSIECSTSAPDYFSKVVDDEPAQVVFSCPEVNNINPLQVQNFKLTNTNKNLFDAVILFSSNVNFSRRDNVVYIHNNDNVQAILNDWEHYIKPLKDQGYKVLLSLLGNHDGSGLANLSDERCRDFAKAIADTLDKYQLDGVFFDDEYSEYERDLAAQGFAGFANRGSSERAARLAYETKKAIGDRWVTIYKYGAFNSLPDVDGVLPGEYVDYILSNYGVVGTWDSNQRDYSGASKRQYGVCSVDVNAYTNITFLKRSRSEKYGALMIYNLDQESAKFDYSYYDLLNKIAKNLFDDTVSVSDVHYKKDWTPVEGLATPNRP